jgi:hypothetical protein
MMTSLKVKHLALAKCDPSRSTSITLGFLTGSSTERANAAFLGELGGNVGVSPPESFHTFRIRGSIICVCVLHVNLANAYVFLGKPERQFRDDYPMKQIPK